MHGGFSGRNPQADARVVLKAGAPPSTVDGAWPSETIGSLLLVGIQIAQNRQYVHPLGPNYLHTWIPGVFLVV